MIELQDEIKCQWAIWLWKTVPICQVIFGTFGNILNITILCRRRLRKYSTTVYLIALAVADLTGLWTATLPNLTRRGFDLDMRMTSSYSCKFVGWINHTAPMCSMWLLVLLTMERMIMIRFPVYSRAALSTRKSVVATIVCLVIISVSCVHYMFGKDIIYQSDDIRVYNYTEKICWHANDEFEMFYTKIWSKVYVLVFNVLATAIIVVANVVILITTFVQRKRLTRINPSQMSKGTSYHRIKSSTKMILVISLFFIITTIPYTANRAISSGQPQTDVQGYAERILRDSIFLILLYCNFTFNFVLYCVSGSVFYQELRAFVCESRKRLVDAFAKVINIRSTQVIRIAAVNTSTTANNVTSSYWQLTSTNTAAMIWQSPNTSAKFCFTLAF